jgi:excisionase family DNA binding protein
MVLAEELITVPEMAARLRISRVRAYTFIEEAGIPHVRLSSRRIRIPREQFEDWLADRTVRGERADTEIASH